MAHEADKLAQSLEEMSAADEEENLDSVDGFRKSIQKKISRFLCTSAKSRSSDDAKSRSSDSSIRSRDFVENTTALTDQQRRAGHEGDTSSDVYDFNYVKRGLAIIINNEKFTSSRDFGDRPGSSYDASALYHSFVGLGFNTLTYNDLPAWKIVEVLRTAASNYDHENADCFACAILTHGDQTWSKKEWDRLGSKVRLDLLFGVDGRAVSTSTVVELFNDKFCPSLKNKPRLFFFQACRGSNLDSGQEILTTRATNFRGISPRKYDAGDGQSRPVSGIAIDVPDMQEQGGRHLSSSVDPQDYNLQFTDSVDALPMGESEPALSGQGSGGDQRDRQGAFLMPMKDVPVSPTPLYKDCLVMYATPPGYYAWRRTTGAWFIQCLCKALDRLNGNYVSLMSMLTLVIGHVARYYQSQNPLVPAMHEKKEIPVIESMLIKDVIFTRKLRRA